MPTNANSEPKPMDYDAILTELRSDPECVHPYDADRAALAIKQLRARVAELEAELSDTRSERDRAYTMTADQDARIAELEAHLYAQSHDTGRHMDIAIEYEKRVTELEAENDRISNLVFDAGALMNRAIRAGDWQIDGACDPDGLLRRIRDERRPSAAKKRNAMRRLQQESEAQS